MESSQTWIPDRYERNAGFVHRLGAEVVDLLDPQPGERILDLGCGHGALTQRLAEAGARVVGVDSSPQQVAAARAQGLDARVGDGEALDATVGADAPFDAVFSNAALHWMLDADAVIDGVWRLLRPGGRFVAEMGGAGNVDSVVRALTAALDARGLDGAAANPWYFPTTGEQARRLTDRGFAVLSITLIPRPTALPGPLSDWLETFAESFLSRLPSADRRAVADEVAAATAPALVGSDGVWRVDYVRLRFAARKPG